LCYTILTKEKKGNKKMYRIKIIDRNCPNTYKWYDDAMTACLVAKAIIRNKDAEKVFVENLKTKKTEYIFEK